MNRPIEFDDFFYSMIPQDDMKTQKFISEKAEFAELASKRKEPIPIRGEYFNHQNFVARYMRFYNRILLMHSTGTGKTCAVTATAEQFKGNFVHSLVDFIDSYVSTGKSHIEKIYILLRGEMMAESFKYLVACACTARGIYETDKVTNNPYVPGKKQSLTKNINKYYTITTYGSFANTLKDQDGKDISIDILRGKYDNSLFVLDEVHNIRPDMSNLRNTYAIDSDESQESLKHTSRNQKAGNMKITESKKREFYESYKRLSHLFRNTGCSVIAMSATPMINYAFEIIPIMNLINDGSYPDMELSENWLNGQTYESLSKYFTGRVSFVRQLDTGVTSKYKGTIINGEISLHKLGIHKEYYTQGSDNISLEINAVFVLMSDAQTAVYNYIQKQGKEGKSVRDIPEYVVRNAGFEPIEPVDFPDDIMPVYTKARTGLGETARSEERIKTSTPDLENILFDTIEIDDNIMNITGESIIETRKSAFFDAERHASTMIYPDGNIMSTGFDKYMRHTGDADIFSANESFKEAFRDPATARILSAKFPHMLNVILSPKTRGTIFVYFPFIKGCGAVTFANYLEVNGFEMYSETSPIFLSKSQVGSYCENATVHGVEQLELMEAYKKPVLRYCLFTSETYDAAYQSMMDTFNSYHNRRGHIIKVFIGSPVSIEGINLFNGSAVLLPFPLWNRSDEFQAVSRMIRATSHKYILDEIRQEMRDNGDTGDPVSKVRIYRYAAVPNDYDPNNIKTWGVDTNMLVLSQFKDIDIKMMERILKRCSVDCIIHKDRNIRDTDVEGSRDCDYSTCNYKCLNEDKYDADDLDFSSKYVLFSDAEVSEAIGIITTLLSDKNEAFLGEIYSLMKTDNNYTKNIVDKAVTVMISEKTIIRDSFWRQNYVYVDDDRVFLAPVYDMSNLGTECTCLDTFYYRNFICTQSVEMDILVNNEVEKISEKFVEKLAENNLSMMEDILGLIEDIEDEDALEVANMKISDVSIKYDKGMVLTDSGYMAEIAPLYLERIIEVFGEQYVNRLLPTHELIMALVRNTGLYSKPEHTRLVKTIRNISSDIRTHKHKMWKLVEYCVLEKYNGMVSPLGSIVLDVMKSDIHVVKKPEKLLAMTMLSITEKYKNRGISQAVTFADLVINERVGRRISTIDKILNDLDVHIPDETGIVIFHNLATVGNNRMIRVFDTNSYPVVWRDAMPHEMKIYINYAIPKKKIVQTDLKIYGVVDTMGNLYIKTTISTKDLFGGGGRKVHDASGFGRSCLEWGKSLDLYILMYHIGFPPPFQADCTDEDYISMVGTVRVKQATNRNALDTLTQEGKNYVLAWFTVINKRHAVINPNPTFDKYYKGTFIDMSTSDLCEELKLFLETTGQMRN